MAKSRSIGRILVGVAASSALALGGLGATAPASSAKTNEYFGSWCWLAHIYSMYKTCNAYGYFYAEGETFKLQDTRTDGRSAVMRIWINGVRHSDLWDPYGNGQYVYRDYSLREGTPVKFQLCVGEYGSRTVTKCQDKYYSAKA